MLVSLLTLASFVKVFYSAFMGPKNKDMKTGEVPASMLIGMAILAGMIIVFSVVPSLVVRSILAVLLPTALLVAHPGEETAMAMGALAGMGLGFLLEGRFVGFSAGGLWWRRGLRFLVGLILVGIFYVGLKAIFPVEVTPSLALAWRAIRYGVVGVIGTFVAPWFFVKTALAEAKGSRSEA